MGPDAGRELSRRGRSTRARASAALLCCAILASCSGPAEVRLKGTVIDNPLPAPDFALTDQNGTAFRLSQAKGKAVVLTFIYTHCTDTCPFLSLKIGQAIRILGPDASRAAFVAVTTDPARDTADVLAAYSRAVGLSTTWHFLTGSPADLQKVWSQYGIAVSTTPAGGPAGSGDASPGPADASSPASGLGATELTLAGLIISRFGGGYEVIHAAPLWFIDPAGRMRAIMDASALPAEIAGNVEALLGRR